MAAVDLAGRAGPQQEGKAELGGRHARCVSELKWETEVCGATGELDPEQRPTHSGHLVHLVPAVVGW